MQNVNRLHLLTMRFLFLLLICLFSFSAFSQQRNATKPIKGILLNGDSVSLQDISLLKPRKSVSVDTLYIHHDHTTDTIYNIRRRVRFLTYADLKSKFNINDAEDPKLVIDGYPMPDVTNFRIDKGFIRSTRLEDNSIQIRTKTKRRKRIYICRPYPMQPAYAQP